MILVSEDFVREALEKRYNQASEWWGSEYSEKHWDEFLDMVVESGCIDATINQVVDNYLVNTDWTQYEEDCEEEDAA